MLTLLRSIVEAFLNLPTYILAGIESLINLFFSGIEAIWIAATSIIPLPSEPSAPEFIGNINWFFPIGAFISLVTPIVVGYIAFIAIRWIYKWVGAL